MTTDASDFPPSSDYLMIGDHREPLPVRATPQGHCLVLSHGHGEFVVVTCGRWLPEPPRHDDFPELCRLQALWSRDIHWEGLTGQELLAKFDRQDMADCHAEVVFHNLPPGSNQEFVPAIPLVFPACPMAHYCPSLIGTEWFWVPTIPDRIDARRRHVLEAVLAKAGINAKIDEFFRSTAELGAGNDEFAALQEFSELVKKRKALRAFLAQPVPHVSFNGWKFQAAAVMPAGITSEAKEFNGDHARHHHGRCRMPRLAE
jgi:hypothetical protein